MPLQEVKIGVSEFYMATLRFVNFGKQYKLLPFWMDTVPRKPAVRIAMQPSEGNQESWGAAEQTARSPIQNPTTVLPP